MYGKGREGLGSFRHGYKYNIKIDIGVRGETTAYIWHKSGSSDCCKHGRKPTGPTDGREYFFYFGAAVQRIIIRYVTLRYIIIFIILYYIVLCYVILCCVVLCYVMLYCVVLCYVMLCYVMLCYVMLCYVMLCYVMLCYVML